MKIRPTEEVWSHFEILLNSYKIKGLTLLLYFCITVAICVLLVAIALFI